MSKIVNFINLCTTPGNYWALDRNQHVAWITVEEKLLNEHQKKEYTELLESGHITKIILRNNRRNFSKSISTPKWWKLQSSTTS